MTAREKIVPTERPIWAVPNPLPGMKGYLVFDRDGVICTTYDREYTERVVKALLHTEYPEAPDA